MAALVFGGIFPAGAQFNTNNFFNWETPPIRPTALSPDGTTLAVCNLAYDHVEIFDVTSGVPVSLASISVGLNPVSVAYRTTNEIWVANYISRTISVINLSSKRVFNTIVTSNQPSDIVFAGTPTVQWAFVSCGQPNLVQVFDPTTKFLMVNLPIDGNRPRMMSVSLDGGTVYVAIFESGNASTIITAGTTGFNSIQKTNILGATNAPSHGMDPPPNSGTNFVPAINKAITNTAPKTGLIVKKNGAGRWMDDNNGDWTEYIRGTNAATTGRVPGWDMPDHDLAIIKLPELSITYASGLMNICMATAVNPVSGKISVIGTDALNQIRFEPVLNGKFIRVELAEVDPANLTSQVVDLNSHLNYQTTQVSQTERDKSIGDPRGIVWSADGARGYITGMGSDNLIIVDAAGNRVGINPTINVGQGPTGLALDDARHRLYVYNRFDGSITTVDTVSETVVATVPLFDPTPQIVKAGRPFLYNTHRTSGLGLASCGSCHVDGRMDRLAWDLGDPSGTNQPIDLAFNVGQHSTGTRTNSFHPMKGPMVTLTFQDIIGHEPFHWRSDKEGLEAFGPTFTNLQSATSTLTTAEMASFKAFLSTIRFPPNPYRQLDNSLSTNVAIPGHAALGRDVLPAGAQLPNGNAQAGLIAFSRPTFDTSGCMSCHSLPTGLGPDMFLGLLWDFLPLSSNGSHHIASMELARSSGLPFKTPQLRNLAEKVGMDLTSTNSRSGFGFGHDGGADTLVRFLQDSLVITNDQPTADMIAFLLSLPGSDLPNADITDLLRVPGMLSLDVPASVGRQITISATNTVALINSMITLANTPSNRVELIVKGTRDGVARGWFYDTNSGLFLSDRPGENYTPNALRMLASAGSEQTYTMVPKGVGRRMGIDRDLDGHLDGELLLRSISATTNGPAIRFTSVPGLNYQLQYKTSLSDSNWITLPGSVAGSGNDMTIGDNGVGGSGARFYRVAAGQ